MPANSGKYLEKSLSDYLDSMKLASTTYSRLPDSRSARNGIKAQTADFLVTTLNSGAFHLECKSVGGAKKILRKPAQYSMMLRWDRAGTRGFFLIHFYELDIYSWLEVSELDSSAKSWPAERSFKTLKDTVMSIISEAQCVKI